MDQSSSSSTIAIPVRGLSLEFFVGLLALCGVLAFAYLAVGLGGATWFSNNSYNIYAEFDNVSGLQTGASVEVGGVPVGSVSAITLKDPQAIVTLSLKKDFKLHTDDVASIRTKGIIGDRYVKISRGAAAESFNAGETITDTESVVDIEDLIGKLVHNMSSTDKDKS